MPSGPNQARPFTNLRLNGLPEKPMQRKKARRKTTKIIAVLLKYLVQLSILILVSFNTLLAKEFSL